MKKCKSHQYKEQIKPKGREKKPRDSTYDGNNLLDRKGILLCRNVPESVTVLDENLWNSCSERLARRVWLQKNSGGAGCDCEWRRSGRGGVGVRS